MNWTTFIRSFFVHPQSTQMNILRAFSQKINPENPYLEKYADKIVKAQKTVNKDKKPEIKFDDLYTKTHEVAKASQSTKFLKDAFKSQVEGFSFKKEKDLSQIMKTETIQEKSADEISSIWKQYHQGKEGLYAILPGEAYEKMKLNLVKYPTFLFPLPRPNGYEFIMCQFQSNSCYFTSLINYQAFKENAPIVLSVTYFTDFQKVKDIVLMRGEYDTNILSPPEAQCLTNQLQLYYGGNKKAQLELLHTFNKNPDQFKHMDLINNFESGLS